MDGWMMDELIMDGWMDVKAQEVCGAVTDMTGALLGSGSRLVRDGAGSASVSAWVFAALRHQPCRLQLVTPNVHSAPLRAPLPAGQQLSKQSRADGRIPPGQGASGVVTRRGGAVSTGWAPADGWQGEAS